MMTWWTFWWNFFIFLLRVAFWFQNRILLKKLIYFKKRSIWIRPMVQNQFDYPPMWRDSKEDPYESQSVQELNKSWVISIYIYSSELRRLVMRVNPLTSRRFSELIQKHITYVLEILRVKSRKVIFLYDQRFILWNQYVFAYFYDKRYFNSTQSNILKIL